MRIYNGIYDATRSGTFLPYQILFDYTNTYLQQVGDHLNNDDMECKVGSPSPRSTASTTMTRDGDWILQVVIFNPDHCPYSMLKLS